MNSPIVAFVVLIAGLSLMIYSSKKTIDHAVEVATALGIPHILIGFIFIAMGTDLPEIVNSILSGYLGHADINIGDSLGSVLSQLTLVFGLLPIIGGVIKVKRKEILVIGCCLILALIILFSIFEKGDFTRLNAFFLLASWALFSIITITLTGKQDLDIQVQTISSRQKLMDVLVVVIGLIGIGVGSFLVVESVIFLSKGINIPEFFISFFIVGIGTSLPELVVDITAIKKKHFDIAIGDILGSCVVDATFSIGIGQFLFPQIVSTELANHTIIYTIVVALIVISILAFRKRVDNIMGAFLILLYILSFLLLFVK